jgi:transposase-like protein
MSYRRYTKEFKEKVLRELGTGENVAAVARRYAVSRQLIYEWQDKQRDGELDDTRPVREAQLHRQIGDLERKVGQLTMENDFLKKTLRRFEQRYPQSEEKTAGNCTGKSREA